MKTLTVSNTLTKYNPNKYFKFSRTSWVLDADEADFTVKITTVI